jgi:hypothetical protein
MCQRIVPARATTDCLTVEGISWVKMCAVAMVGTDVLSAPRSAVHFSSLGRVTWLLKI